MTKINTKFRTVTTFEEEEIKGKGIQGTSTVSVIFYSKMRQNINI